MSDFTDAERRAAYAIWEELKMYRDGLGVESALYAAREALDAAADSSAPMSESEQP